VNPGLRRYPSRIGGQRKVASAKRMPGNIAANHGCTRLFSR